MAENKRNRKSLAFFGWPKIKGTESFPKPLYNSKQKRKICIYRRWPKIKGPELGEGGRKLKGPKIKAELQPAFIVAATEKKVRENPSKI